MSKEDQVKQLRETFEKLKEKNKTLTIKCNDELNKQKNEIITLKEKLTECRVSKKQLQDINIELTVFTLTEVLEEHLDEVKGLAITSNSK
jgi:hypothetical protein